MSPPTTYFQVLIYKDSIYLFTKLCLPEAVVRYFSFHDYLTIIISIKKIN